MGGRRIKIFPWPDPCSISIICLSTTPDAYESHVQCDVQHLIRSRHAMTEGTMGGKSPIFKAHWVAATCRGLRESGLGSWVGLPWKSTPYSLQVTNSWKSFTNVISSYCCACGYFVYSLRAFHWKRQQHFPALGNRNICRLQLPKPTLRLQESTSAAGSLRAVWLTLGQWRHSFVSGLFVASSQTTCIRGDTPFLHRWGRCWEVGAQRSFWWWGYRWGRDSLFSGLLSERWTKVTE